MRMILFYFDTMYIISNFLTEIKICLQNQIIIFKKKGILNFEL